MKSIKKGLSLLLAAAMLLTVQPLSTSAAETAGESDTSIVAETPEMEESRVVSETEETNTMPETEETNAVPETPGTEETTAAGDRESTKETESMEESTADETEMRSAEETSESVEESTIAEESTAAETPATAETVAETTAAAENPEETTAQNDLAAEPDGEISVRADIVDSGTLNTGLSWVLDADGVLTISGSGAIPDFSYMDIYNDKSVWLENQDLISTVIIEEGVTGIGSLAFFGCSELSVLILPESLKQIGREAFGSCTSLTDIKIPDSIETIGAKAFNNCRSLTTVRLPEGLEEIANEMFKACTALETIALPGHLKRIGAGAFEACRSLTEMVIPDSVEMIGDSAFSGCPALASVTLPVGIKQIRPGTFSYCNALTFIQIPDTVSAIEYDSFIGCSALASLDLPKSLKEIGSHAFASCTSLTALEIPDSAERIGRNAFSGCSSLANVTIGSGVSRIEGNIFGNCFALRDITFRGNGNYIAEDGVIFTGDKKALVAYLSGNDRKSYTVPESVTEISYAAFCSNRSLKEVDLPQNLREIGEWAFAGTDLDGISIPSQTEKIGRAAFESNSCSLIYVYARNAEIGQNAFTDYVSEPVLYGYEGSTTQKYVEENDWFELTFIPFSESETGQPLPTGVQYVPYEVSLPGIEAYTQEADYKLIDGSLPSGMTLEKSGILKGTPTQEGTYVFTIQRRGGESVHLTTYKLEIRDNTNINVEDITDPGYELIEYVPDLYLDSLTPGGSHTLRSRGEYEEFRDVYLDGRKLQAGVDYTAESGSTRITIQDQTLTENGTGTHTIGIEFRTKDTNELRRAAQNYTVAEAAAPAPGESEAPDAGEEPGNNPGENTGGNNGENSGGNSSETPGGNNDGNSGENGGENDGSGQDSGEASAESFPETISYVIERGDTLWKLAARFFGSGRYWQRIFQANTDILRNPNRLRIGQVITIFLDSADTPPAQPDTEAAGNTYMVQPGDSLWRIASRVYGQGRLWRRIFEANRDVIADPGRIYRRQVFIIPGE